MLVLMPAPSRTRKIKGRLIARAIGVIMGEVLRGVIGGAFR